jgi:lipoate-protein ligase A
MYLYRSDYQDPHFNLATEEYLLKNYKQDFFLIYLNSPSVIVGKHQNTMAEINYNYIQESGIPVIRRLSGGGTVYHDPGNINFTFIASGISNKLSDFKKYTAPVMQTMEKLGLQPEYSNRNDLLINGLKFSGNAEHIWKNRILHHGTILFNSNLDILNESINSKNDQFEDKAVKSVKSQVTNISPLLKDVTIQDFIEELKQTVLGIYDHCKEFTLTERDHREIQKLVGDKYSTWKWNYGYSPAFKVKKTITFRETPIQIEITTKDGIISDVFFSGKIPDFSFTAIENELRGVPYTLHKISHAVRKSNIQETLPDLHKEEFIRWLF